MIKAVIFDFNGTLYYDYDINTGGWEKFYEYFYKTSNGKEEYGKEAIHHNNRINVIKALKSINKEIDERQVCLLSRKKETFYHQLAIEKMRFNLAAGVDKLLNYLKERNIKVNICTASIKYNVDFYFDMTKLSKWFNKELVSYDNGKVDGKVEMYKVAAENINVDIEDCLVFEDSIGGIDDAIKAGFKKIIYVNHYNLEKIERKEILQEIHDYSELDYSLFQ